MNRVVRVIIVLAISIVFASSCSTEGVRNKGNDVGDTLTFGQYEQDNNLDNGPESIEWVIIYKKDKKAIAISKYCLDNRAYDDSKRKSVSWNKSSLQKWLNGDFYNKAFSKKEKKKIGYTKVSGEDKKSYVTLLDEAMLYNFYNGYSLKNKEIALNDGSSMTYKISEKTSYKSLAAQYTEYAKAKVLDEGAYRDYDTIEKDFGERAAFWWTKAAGADGKIVEITPSGGAIDAPCTTKVGVRPVILLTID